MRIGLGKQQLVGGGSALLLLAVIVGALALAVVAEEKPYNQVLTSVSSTALSGYVSSSVSWKSGSPQTPTVSLLGFTNGHAELLLTVVGGRSNRVDVSTNLVTWEPVASLLVPIPQGEAAGVASVSMTHSNAALLPRFYYRLVELP